MPDSDPSMTRRSFVEKVALAAGITAAGGEALFENLKPGTAQASTGTTPPTGADLMNSGAFGWDLTPAGHEAAVSSDTVAPANLSAQPNILMLMVDQLRLPQFWLSADQQYVVDTMCPEYRLAAKHLVQLREFLRLRPGLYAQPRKPPHRPLRAANSASFRRRWAPANPIRTPITLRVVIPALGAFPRSETRYTTSPAIALRTSCGSASGTFQTNTASTCTITQQARRVASIRCHSTASIQGARHKFCGPPTTVRPTARRTKATTAICTHRAVTWASNSPPLTRATNPSLTTL